MKVILTLTSILFSLVAFAQNDTLWAKESIRPYVVHAIDIEEGRLNLIYNGEKIAVSLETVDTLKLYDGRIFSGKYLKDGMFFINFPTNEEEKVEYTGIERTDSVSGLVLHQRAKFCMVELFNSFKDVTQNNDENAGVLMIKGYMGTSASFLWATYKVRIEFSLTMEFKTGRYRYTVRFWKFEISFDNLTYHEFVFNNNEESPNGMFVTRKMWKEIKTGTFSECQRFLYNMKRCMSTPRDGDW